MENSLHTKTTPTRIKSATSKASEDFDDRLSDIKTDRTSFSHDTMASNFGPEQSDDDVLGLKKTVNVHQFYPIIEFRSDGDKSRSNSTASDESFGLTSRSNDLTTKSGDDGMDDKMNTDGINDDSGDVKREESSDKLQEENVERDGMTNFSEKFVRLQNDSDDDNKFDDNVKIDIIVNETDLDDKICHKNERTDIARSNDVTDHVVNENNDIHLDDKLTNDKIHNSTESNTIIETPTDSHIKTADTKQNNDKIDEAKDKRKSRLDLLTRLGSSSGLELATISETGNEEDVGFGDVNNSALGSCLDSHTGVGLKTESSSGQADKSDIIRTFVPPVDVYTGDLYTMDDIINARVCTLMTKAESLKKAHNYVGALSHIHKAMILKPNTLEHYVECGECYLQLTDIQTSILYLKRACFLDPANEELFDKLAFVFYFQGQVLFDQHHFEESLEAFTRATEIKPNNTIYNTRGLACLAALGRHNECLALINKRLEEETDNADLFIMRARLHQLYGNLTLVFYDTREALRLNPNHHEARLILSRQEALAEECKLHGMRLMINEKYQEALQKFNSAIDINPSVDNYHILRGTLHRKMGDFNQAIDDFLLGLDKGGHDETSTTYINAQRQLLLTYNDFAVECFNKAYYDEAIVLLNKAIKGEKHEKGLYVNRGDCFLHQDLTFALQDYHQALEIDPTDQSIRSRISVVHGEFGMLAFMDKDFPEAEAKFSLAIQYNPHVAQHYISRCRTRYMLNDILGARQDLLLALLLNPNEEDILSIHARLFPGKSVGEVLASKAALDMTRELDNLVSSASPVRLRPIESSQKAFQTSSPPPKSAVQSLSIVQSEPEGGQTRPPVNKEIKSCAQNIQDVQKMALKRKRINTDIRLLLRTEPNLTYKGPRIKPIDHKYNLGITRTTKALH